MFALYTAQGKGQMLLEVSSQNNLFCVVRSGCAALFLQAEPIQALAHRAVQEYGSILLRKGTNGRHQGTLENGSL